MSQQQTELIQKAEEIALLLVMLGESDGQGLAMVANLCEDLCQKAEAIKELQKMTTSWKWIKSQGISEPSSKTIQLLNKFASAANALLAGSTSVEFPFDDTSSKTSSSASTVESPFAERDESLLAEFVETHSLLLEEFDSSLLEAMVIEPSATQELVDATTAAKRYLHNLKGDAGSLGLGDIERVCHFLEDCLMGTMINAFGGELFAFKEWCTERLADIVERRPFSITGAAFIERIEKSRSRSSSTTQSTTSQPAPSAVAQPAMGKGATPELPPQYTMSGDKEIFTEFAAEAEEHLASVETTILESEGTFQKEEVDTIFRAVHSVKGGSAYFTLTEMTRTSHTLENILSEARDGKRTIDDTLKGLILTYIDLQKTLMAAARQAVQSNGEIKTIPQSGELLAKLNDYLEGKSATPVVEPTVSAPVAEAALPPPTSVADQSSDSKGEKLGVKNFVKVDTDRLDKLIDSIGEMVIYSSMLVRQCREHLGHNQGVLDTTHRVEKFGRDLQDIGMSMRLVPIRGLFQKMSRLVWDTSKKLGKQIEFSMTGEDTELDRNLIDRLADPLMHMVRNSLDHGIEPPEERLAKGKTKSGNVSLSAYHSGGTIHIQIKDDGRGINPEKVRAKALEKGIIDPNDALTREQIYQLLFAPGFSTAAVVTDISGRGVGMDVVRRNVEGLRGTIHIESEVDKGSTFTIQLPLTLAIIDGIDVRVGSDHFIIPSLSIVEFVRPKPSSLSYPLDRGETFQFRGKYLPVYRLGVLYGVPSHHSDPYDATIVVVENGSELIALLVDEIHGEYSTVIKSLGPIFQESKGLAGCAIMPNGDVSLILDIRSLIQLARDHYLHHAVPRPGGSGQVSAEPHREVLH